MPAKGFRIDPKQRFMAKIRRDRWGHWQWVGAKSGTGYGTFTWGGRGSGIGAHRAAWLLFRGPVPDGMDIHHICTVRSCVNPDHLLVVTPRQNTIERSLRKGRIDVCKHGHPMEGDNVAWTIWKNGYAARYCRECARIANRAQYAKHADARREYANTIGYARRRQHQHDNASIETLAM